MSILQISLTRIPDSFLDPTLLDIYYELEKNHSWKKKWEILDESQIWKELCFCLLSGNVAFELAKSTVDVLEKRGFLNHRWILEEKQSQEFIFKLFNGPNFEPTKKDGQLRKYRYPKKRSEEITAAAKILYSNSSIKEILEESATDIEVRNFLAKEIPGIGIKESSHFLRNIGFSNALAIIDVHVLNFLKQEYFVDPSDIKNLTESKYVKLEIILQNLAEFHGLDLGVLDLAIWHYMRNKAL